MQMAGIDRGAAGRLQDNSLYNQDPIHKTFMAASQSLANIPLLSQISRLFSRAEGQCLQQGLGPEKEVPLGLLGGLWRGPRQESIC